jgi:hypothetical protein
MECRKRRRVVVVVVVVVVGVVVVVVKKTVEVSITYTTLGLSLCSPLPW